MEPLSLPQQARPVHRFAEFCSTAEPRPLQLTDTSVQTSLLCTRCQQIRLWLESNLHRLDRHPFIRITRRFDHYRSGRELEQSYRQGCHLCTIIWTSFLHLYIPPLSHISKKEPLSNSRDFQVVLKPYHVWPHPLSLYISMRNPKRNSPSLNMRLSKDDPPEETPPGFPPPIPTYMVPRKMALHHAAWMAMGDWLRQMARRNVKPAYPVSVTSLPLNTSSGKILQQINDWIQTCEASHMKCKLSTYGFLPSRLIDLGDVQRSSIIRVVDSSRFVPIQSKYVTLSYCWGGKSKLQLNWSNMSTLEAGVSVSALPKTIQDAIYLTAQLGLRWLWVDSLCIIQDSAEDKAREIQSMKFVYQNCFISIAALDAKHNDEGLYASRDPLMYGRCELVRISANRAIDIGSGDRGMDHFAVPPLYCRGWVVQERMLPPRTVILGRTVAWECRECRQVEFDGAEHVTRLHGIKSDFFDAVTASEGKLSDDEVFSIRKVWDDILIEYFKTDLTEKSDRLDAISAIISAIQARTSWENVAGLWVPFLFTELLWRKLITSKTGRSALSPSWSWVAVDCDVYRDLETIAQRLVEVDLEDGDVEYLQRNRTSTSQKPMALRVSGFLMEYRAARSEDFGTRASYAPRVFQDLPHIGITLYHADAESYRDYTGYFIPFAKLYSKRIVGLSVLKLGPGVFMRKGYIELTDRENSVQLILRFLKTQKRATFHIL